MLKKAAFIVLVSCLIWWYICQEEEFNPDVISGKRVLVTGASSGIGESIALILAEYGASVIITARREEQLQKVVKSCQDVGKKDAVFDYMVADMNENVTQRVIDFAVSKLGGLDYLVLNHAWMPDAFMWEGTDDNLQLLKKVLNINFHSFVALTSRAIPHLKQSQGAIHAVNSLYGKVPGANLLPYTAAKHAMNGFFNGMREEFQNGDTNVTITISILGYIKTEQGNHALKKVLKVRKASPGKLQTIENLGGGTADCAQAIIKQIVRGDHELFHPSNQYVKFMTKLYGLSPGLYSAFMESQK